MIYSLAGFLATIVQIFIYCIVIDTILNVIPGRFALKEILDAICSWYVKPFIKIAKGFGLLLSFLPLIILKSLLTLYSTFHTLKWEWVLRITIRSIYYDFIFWILLFYIILLGIYLFNKKSIYFVNLALEKFFSKVHAIFFSKQSISDNKIALLSFTVLIIIIVILSVVITLV